MTRWLWREIGESKVSELEQLQKRIDKSGIAGVETAHIRDDYEPAGQMMINSLVESGEYVTRKVGLLHSVG